MSDASPSLSSPLYGATFGQAVSRYFRKYATFSGRASRSEYWWVALALFLVNLVPNVLLTTGMFIGIRFSLDSAEPVTYDHSDGTQEVLGYTQSSLFEDPTAATLITIGMVISVVIALATLIPTLALTWRRLHDTNIPGPLYFITFIPPAGLVVLIMLLQRSKPEGARFDQGAVPQAPRA